MIASARAATECSIEDVISHNYCVGCGACAAASPSAFSMVTDELMTRQAVIHDASDKAVAAGDRVCPFSSQNPNETEIAEALFAQNGLALDERVGYYDAVFTGQVQDSNYLLGSSSGGLTSWIVGELLRSGLVDGIIHVGEADCGTDTLFEYVVSYSTETAAGRRKSQYYSTSFDHVLGAIRGDGKRYAFIGVPCFVKAVRLLQAADPMLADQITYVVGLVCGHLKSNAFAEVMAYQVGVNPGEVKKVDFRVKNPDWPANMYGFGAMQLNRHAWRTKTASSLVGGNWGHALFQLKACDYCDDIFAETADICLGDAWLPDYVKDWRGTNVVVSRRKELTLLLEAARGASQISLHALTLDEAAESQAGNFRHRREGLSVRLAAARAQSLVVPRKRVSADSVKVSRQRRKVVFARQRIAQVSHKAYLQARVDRDIGVLFRAVGPLIEELDNIYRRAKYKTFGFWVRLPVRGLKGLVQGVRHAAQRSS